MPEGKKPLITRERYKAYLQEKEKQPKESMKEPPQDAKPLRRKSKAEAGGSIQAEKQPERRYARIKKAKDTFVKPIRFRRESIGKTEAKSRLSEKERGRRLDRFYNWAIILVLVAIILVFVLAFVI